MGITILIIVVIVFLIIIFVNGQNGQQVEHYNARLVNTDLVKCGEFCKTTAGCFGFGYDKNNQICYPSKSLIDGAPTDSDVLYRDQYNKNNPSCNKLEPIIQPDKKPPFDNRRKNSIYVCKETEDLQPQWYLHSDNKFTNIGDGKNIDGIFNVDDYPINAYQWPINKYNMDQVNLLEKDRLAQVYNSQTISSLTRMETPDVESEGPVLPEYTGGDNYVQLDFGLERFRNYIINKLSG
jgi:hypothetical protein